MGGEAASLAVPYSHSAAFAQAGYAPLLAGADGTTQGLTRQLGNFSFTRVFQAGHEVPSYQPEAAYRIFSRATFGLDIPTGLFQTDDDYATVGPRGVWHVKSIPETPPAPRCYILKPMTCVPAVWEKVLRGAVTVKDWFVVDEDSDGQGDRVFGDERQNVLDEL